MVALDNLEATQPPLSAHGDGAPWAMVAALALHGLLILLVLLLPSKPQAPEPDNPIVVTLVRPPPPPRPEPVTLPVPEPIPDLGAADAPAALDALSAPKPKPRPAKPKPAAAPPVIASPNGAALPSGSRAGPPVHGFVDADAGATANTGDAAALGRALGSGAGNGAGGYGEDVRRRIEKARAYPAAARARGYECTVPYRLKLDAAGEILDMALSLCGRAELDIAARNAILAAAPFPKPPDGGQIVSGVLNFRVP